MQNGRREFVALLTFLTALVLILTNGFIGRISADEAKLDIFAETEPIGVVLDEVLTKYVETPEVSDVVEGAIMGMMSSSGHLDYSTRSRAAGEKI